MGTCTIYCVSNAKEDLPYCHIFGTFILLQKLGAQAHYNMRSLSWMRTWNSIWAEVTAKLKTYSMQYLCCARNLENNILFCEEFTWNHKCFLIFLEHSVSEKMEIIFIEEQKCWTHRTLQIRLLMALTEIGCQSPIPSAVSCSHHQGTCKGCYEPWDRELKVMDGRFMNHIPVFLTQRIFSTF